MKPLNEIDVQITEPGILDASKKLARAIGESSQYHRYERSNKSLQADQKAKQLLSKFQQEQQNLQMMQSWGGASLKDFEQFEKLQKQLFSDPTLKEYFGSQEELVLMLKELDVFLSEKLGFDFANLTKPAGGCC